MHNVATPTRIRRYATRVAITSGVLCVGVVVAWGLRLIPEARPTLVVMLYLLLVAVTLGASVTAIGAHCHLTVQRAFLAGMHVGAQLPADTPRPTPLRVVD